MRVTTSVFVAAALAAVNAATNTTTPTTPAANATTVATTPTTNTTTPTSNSTTTPTTSNTTDSSNSTTITTKKTTRLPSGSSSADGSAGSAATVGDTTVKKTLPSDLIKFRSVKGEVYADDKPFYFKGVNWFGFETIESVLQGLWPYGTTVGDALDLLRSYDINSLRLPLALDSILGDQEVDKDQTAGTPSLAGKSYLDVLDFVIGEARARNMLVILANQRMKASEPDFPDTADTVKIIPALQALAKRYCNNPSAWNVVGIDLKNEPKGNATWGSGDPLTDWQLQATEIGNAVLEKCDRWLMFVEGVQNNIDGVELDWGQAGGSLQGVKKQPVKLKVKDRVVYSPHLLPPGVDWKSPWFFPKNFDKNMPKLWDAYFGYVPKASGSAVVIGAWGSKMEGNDGKWARAVVNYLSEHNLGSFYWAFNPQSADTGGLVKDDWKTPIAERFELLGALPVSNVADFLKKYAKCSSKCKGNGQCVDGLCQCYAGWSGPQCDVCTAGDRTACNNAGTCQKDSTCQCEKGSPGEYCNGADCFGISCGSSQYAGCVNGQCVCSFNCLGGSCTQCAANSSALTGNVTKMCDVCPAPDSAASTGSLVSLVSVVVALSGLLLSL